jgi:7-keto-8-aminopelargonate synthetase-like enzyme
MRIFPHNDLAKLESHLRWAHEQIGNGDGRILILTESVFSMDGDVAPLIEIVELKKEHDALLLVDEAHAFGVFGPDGRGYAAELGLDSDIDFQMGTLSKAAVEVICVHQSRGSI